MREMAQQVSTKAFLQPAKNVCAQNVTNLPAHFPFFASAKAIFKTDCINT